MKASLSNGLLIAESGALIERVVLVGVNLESHHSTIYNGNPGVQDFVIANCRIFNRREIPAGYNGWAMRNDGPVTRGAFIDSYFRSVENTTIRPSFADHPQTDVHYARNQIDYGQIWGFRTEAGITFTRLSVINNNFYAIPDMGGVQTGGGEVGGPGEMPDRGTFVTAPVYTGNTLRAPVGSPWFANTTSNPWTYEAVPTIPVWEMQ